MTTSPTAASQYGSSSQSRSQGGGPSRSKSLGRAAEGSSRGNNSSTNSKSKSGKGGTTSPPYRDVIDKLDLSGLLGGGFHHSGPFDAASSMQRSNAPIAAFSQSALDPAYSGSPANAASNGTPSRESSYPRQARAGGGGGNGGNGSGISARAKATLAAMGGTEPHFNDPNASSENLLSGMASSDQSITLGYPSNETHAKERKIMEAFGVHEEAYLDYGNSSYARKPPRASVAPSPNSSMTSFSSSNSPNARGEGGMGKMTRADRTASIWDIEATLREGRPVGAAPPPPMPVIPDRFLQAPFPTSPTNGEGGVKRSKSLLARMRSKKGAMISSPSSKEAPQDSNYFSNSAGPAPLPYERSNSARSASNDGAREKEGYSSLYDNSVGADAESKHDYLNYNQRPEYNDDDRRRPDMGSRRSTSPAEQRIANNYLKPTMSSPQNSGYADDGNYGQGQPSMNRSQSSSGGARRSPQPPSPLGLPEGPGDIFGGSSGDPYSGSALKPSISRSHRNGDLANESALAAILAESSSKESGMSHSTSSSSNNSGYGGGGGGNGNGNSSGYGYAHTDTSYASDRTSTPERSRLESHSLGNSTASNSSSNHTPSPAEGKLSRKTSLASRLLRGRKKPSS